MAPLLGTPALLLALAAAQSPRPGSAADSVRALDAAWARAYATHDTVPAHALFADDIVVTSSGGAVKTKRGELADVRPAPGLQMAYFRPEDGGAPSGAGAGRPRASITTAGLLPHPFQPRGSSLSDRGAGYGGNGYRGTGRAGLVGRDW